MRDVYHSTDANPRYIETGVGVTRFRTNAAGDRTIIEELDGTASSYLYDIHGQLVEFSTATDFSAAPVTSLEIGYSTVGNSVLFLYPDDTRRSGDFDPVINKITQWTVLDGTTQSTTTETFTYDSVGNLDQYTSESEKSGIPV